MDTTGTVACNPGTVQAILELYRQQADNFLGEAVSQVDHARRSAFTAARRPDVVASDVVAALLHDIGHLLSANRMRDAAGQDLGAVDHDDVGADWLASRGLPDSVTEPVRFHTAAKAYLSARDPDYLERLSNASRQTLAIQQPGLADKLRRLRRHPLRRNILRLRRTEDASELRRTEDASEPDDTVPTDSMPTLAQYLRNYLREGDVPVVS